MGCFTAPVYCTKIASRLIRTYTDRHGLKEFVRELLEIDISKQQQSSDWGAGFAAARRAGRTRPIEALFEAAGPTRSIGLGRTAMGLAAAVGTAVLFKVAASVSGPVAPAVTLGVFATAILAVGLLAPLLVRIGVAGLGTVLGRLGATGFLAGANSRHQGARLASAVTPLALTIGIAGMTLFQQSTLDATAERQGSERLLAEHVVAADGPGVAATSVDDLPTRQRARPSAFDRQPSTRTAAGSVSAHAVTSGRLGDVLDLHVSAGSVDDLAPDEVALSEYAADSMGAKLGGRVDLRLGDGTHHSARVGAVYDRSLGFGDVVLPWEGVAAHVGDCTVSTVLVSDGGSPGQLGGLLDAVRVQHPGVEVGGGEIIAAAADANAETQAWVNYALLGMVILFAAFALLNTLMLCVAGRVRELGLLRLVGGTRRQVLGMMRLEVVLTLLIGCALGAAVAAVTVLPFAKAVSGSFRPGHSGAPGSILAGGAVLLGLVGTMLPTRGVLRTRPVDAIGIRE